MYQVKEIVKFDMSNARNRSILSEHFVFGHFSIGAGIITIGGARVSNTLYFGVSMCSPYDNFSKKLGRKKVIENFFLPKNSNKRGAFVIPNVILEEPPAIVLKQAVEDYLTKLKQRPHWMSTKNVKFR